MDVALSAAFAFGFLSGFRHAFEPDHVVAVSTMVHREPRLWRALRLGIAWGAGHTTMLMVAVLAVGVLRIPVSESVLAYLELPVAVMLIGLGFWALVDAVRRTAMLRGSRQHDIDQPEGGTKPPSPMPAAIAVRRSALQGYVVGMVHGLAGSGTLLLLVAATLPSAAVSLFYALIFGLGSILGMVAVTAIIAAPLLTSRSRPNFYSALTGLAGALSIALGGIILAGILL